MLARNRSFACWRATEIESLARDSQTEGSGLVYNSVGRKGAPKLRELAAPPEIDEAGDAVKFQSQTLKVARYCVRNSADPKGAGSADSDPSSGSEMEADAWPSLRSGRDVLAVPRPLAVTDPRNVASAPAAQSPWGGHCRSD